MPDPIRQLTLTPALTALVKDVFGPSAKLVGTELRSFLKERFDDARERRRSENLSRHISVVRAALPKPPPEQVSYDRFDMFSEWVEGAQDVSDSDPELAEMWREVLRRIIEGESVSKSLISIMKQVDAQMARILLCFRRKKSPLDEVKIPFEQVMKVLGFSRSRRFADGDLFNARRLEAIGLLDRDYSPILLRCLSTGIVIFGGYVAWGYLVGLEVKSSPFNSEATLATTFKVFVVGVVLVFFVLNSLRGAISRPAFRLNWTGRRLLTYAVKLEDRDEKVP
jgi:hypothetical protein